ncbi:MAG TPA: sodium-dependent transporter [Acidobacteria bacterium]|nr:sodium-dependent transporter [Acidobacteriota bacterium]HCE01949.1 sodium-dependent transporter [Acidobacteriota bacterium]
MATTAQRGTWGSKAGFILAAAGSAVGLGNIWGFPTQVGQGGGAVFVLIYLTCVLFICLPIMLAELVLGRRAQLDPVGSFSLIRPGSNWWLVGALGVLAGAGILSFYSVIAGWSIAYIWFTASGAVTGDADAVGVFFGNFTANGPLSVGLTLVILTATAAVLVGGVQSGIERVTKVMMPALIGLLLILAIRAASLPGAAEGLAYYLRPDFSRILDPAVINAALGQAFFSLSLGMGAMLTYGSYLSKRESLVTAACWVVALDTGMALLAGFIIFPSGFSIEGFDPSAGGPGLIFAVLPRLFATLPGGQLVGAAFFILLTMAALTSTISLLEVPVAHFIDAHKWTRRKAVLLVTTGVFLLAVPSALGNGAVGVLGSLPVLGVDFLTMMGTVWNDFALPIGGLLTAVFVGWVWRVDQAIEEIELHGVRFPARRLWSVLIRYVCPVAISVIIVYTFMS